MRFMGLPSACTGMKLSGNSSSSLFGISKLCEISLLFVCFSFTYVMYKDSLSTLLISWVMSVE